MAAKKKGKKGAPKRPVGRPPEPVPQDIADRVIAWVESGKPLAELCREPGMPNRRTIGKWRAKDEEFRARFARAREDGFDEIADECLAIADDASNDWMERTGNDGDSLGWQLNGEAVQRSRLRIDTRMQLLARWCPGRYGQKVAIGGSASLDPIKVESAGPPVPSDADLVAGIAKLAELGRELLHDDDGDADAG